MVRMEWTFKDFFSKGGTTAFSDRVAGSLGIHASQIKVVSVYEGSLVVNYEMTVAQGEPASKLLALKKKQTEMYATGKMDLGAPILDVQTGEDSIISDGQVSAQGFEPIVITKGVASKKNVVRKRGVFNPNINTVYNASTVYKNVTVTKIREEKREIVIKKVYNEKQGGLAIMVIAVAVLLFIISFVAYRFISYQLKKDVLDA